MPRKSADHLSVVTHLPGAPLEAPSRLDEEGRQLWREIVATKPFDWFQADAAPLLEAYCHAVVAHRRVSACAQKFTTEDLEASKGLARFENMLRIQDRQSRLMATLATKLRLTMQARYGHRSANTAANRVGTGPRPWDTD